MDKFFSKSIIIGIHGLDNKPPDVLLKKWWKKAIREGLKRSGYHHLRVPFRLVYWANFFYEAPQDPSIRDPKHPLYLDDPYTPSAKKPAKFTPSRFKQRVLDYLEEKMDSIFFRDDGVSNFDKISEFIIRKLFSDLDIYYHRVCPSKKCNNLRARESLRNELARVIRKYRKKKILLIAHSMGSIIAYDTLTQSVPDLGIDTFLTIGSPLGLPVIMKKIFSEQGLDYRERVPSPENVKSRWQNFSDLDDRVAINYNLADDYEPNTHGIGPEDFIVKNDYTCKGEDNAHKSYGYLRAPEVSRAIHEFLNSGRSGIVSRLFSLIDRFS